MGRSDQSPGYRHGAPEPLGLASKLVEAGAILLGDQFAHPELPPIDGDDVQASDGLRLQPALGLDHPPGIGDSTRSLFLGGAREKGGTSCLLDVEDSTLIELALAPDQHGVSFQPQAARAGDTKDDIQNLEPTPLNRLADPLPRLAADGEEPPGPAFDSPCPIGPSLREVIEKSDLGRMNGPPQQAPDGPSSRADGERPDPSVPDRWDDCRPVAVNEGQQGTHGLDRGVFP
jgi:hypothetical protein